METGYRDAAAAQSGAMDAGVRGLQDHPAISSAQRRHESRRVQDDLLVGVEPPAARARDRRGLSAAVSLVPVARRSRRRTAAATVADLRPRRATRRGRLVDGCVGTFATGRGFAISFGHASGARAPDFCRACLDAAPAWREDAVGYLGTAQSYGGCLAGADVRAALFGRVGRGPARGQDLQYLAGYRRCVDSLRGAAFL